MVSVERVHFRMYLHWYIRKRQVMFRPCASLVGAVLFILSVREPHTDEMYRSSL